MNLPFGAAEAWLLLAHFVSISLLAVGGVISTLPESHRFLVERQHWLSDAQFTASVALAQAAPGPNLLFVALLGWNVGLNAGGGGALSHVWGLAGLALAMSGVLIPSTVLTLLVSRWAQRNRELRAVRAFKQGMAPVVIALLLATGVVLASSLGAGPAHWPVWLLAAVSALVVWRTRLHLLWLLALGAALGALGLV